MINRTLVASFIVLAAIGGILMSAEAVARAGGMGGVRAAPFHGGFHRFPARPFVRVAPVPRTAVTPLPAHGRIVGPGSSRFAPERRHFSDHIGARGWASGRHRRGDFGGDFGGAGVSGGYGGLYPVGDATPPGAAYGPPPGAAYGPPPDAGSANPAWGGFGPPAPYRHVCRSVAQMVPSERGGEREITITRCYVVTE